MVNEPFNHFKGDQNGSHFRLCPAGAKVIHKTSLNIFAFTSIALQLANTAGCGQPFLYLFLT